MRAFGMVLLVASLFAAPVAAQNNVTTQRIGDVTYYSGTLNGEPVTGSATQIGNIVYYNLSVGGRLKSWTQQVIGSQAYSNGSDGSSANSQRVGSQTYTTVTPAPSYSPPQPYVRPPTPITYTTQRIGNFVYTHGSNGCSSTTQIIGSQTYTTGNCPK